jgi:hypothetical protein
MVGGPNGHLDEVGLSAETTNASRGYLMLIRGLVSARAAEGAISMIGDDGAFEPTRRPGSR